MRSGSCVAKPLATTNTARQPISPFPVKLLIAAVLQYSRVEKLRGCEQRDRDRLVCPLRVCYVTQGWAFRTQRFAVKDACFRAGADNNPVLLHKSVGFQIGRASCRGRG